MLERLKDAFCIAVLNRLVILSDLEEIETFREIYLDQLCRLKSHSAA